MEILISQISNAMARILLLFLCQGDRGGMQVLGTKKEE